MRKTRVIYLMLVLCVIIIGIGHYFYYAKSDVVDYESIDELVGNDFKHTSKEECGSKTKARGKIYTGLTFICGTIAGIWAFSANRFRYDEMLMIVAGGMTIGLLLASVCQAILNN